jgi:hypothetical protein
VDVKVHGTRAELVVVSVGSEDDRTRRSMERCSRRKKRRRGVACGRLRSGGARGGRLGAAQPVAAGVEVCGAIAWLRGRARHGAPQQLRVGVQERRESCELLRLEQRKDKAQVTWGR